MYIKLICAQFFYPSLLRCRPEPSAGTWKVEVGSSFQFASAAYEFSHSLSCAHHIHQNRYISLNTDKLKQGQEVSTSSSLFCCAALAADESYFITRKFIPLIA